MSVLTGMAAHIHAYRLLKRSVLLTMPKGPRHNPSQSLTEYVIWWLEQPGGAANSTRLGDLVRGLAREKRSLELYSPEEMAEVCQRIVKRIDSVSPGGDGTADEKARAAERALAWPNWPHKWRESYDDTVAFRLAGTRKDP